MFPEYSNPDSVLFQIALIPDLAFASIPLPKGVSQVSDRGNLVLSIWDKQIREIDALGNMQLGIAVFGRKT